MHISKQGEAVLLRFQKINMHIRHIANNTQCLLFVHTLKITHIVNVEGLFLSILIHCVQIYRGGGGGVTIYLPY